MVDVDPYRCPCCWAATVTWGAPSGCSASDRDLLLFMRWFKEAKMPLDMMVTRHYARLINALCDDLVRSRIARRATIDF